MIKEITKVLNEYRETYTYSVGNGLDAKVEAICPSNIPKLAEDLEKMAIEEALNFAVFVAVNYEYLHGTSPINELYAEYLNSKNNSNE